jgi:hypothetical protein
MSGLGQSRHTNAATFSPNVRFAPQSGHLTARARGCAWGWDSVPPGGSGQRWTAPLTLGVYACSKETNCLQRRQRAAVNNSLTRTTCAQVLQLLAASPAAPVVNNLLTPTVGRRAEPTYQQLNLYARTHLSVQGARLALSAKPTDSSLRKINQH